MSNVNAAEADGATALMWAAHNSDAELAVRLLKAGADAKARNQFGATPMSEAAFVGNAGHDRERCSKPAPIPILRVRTVKRP